MKQVKIRKIGNSAGVVFSKDILELLDADIGDDLTFFRDENGVHVKTADEGVEDIMKSAEEIMERRFKVLRALSK